MKYSAFNKSISQYKSINYYLRSWKVTAVNTDKLEKKNVSIKISGAQVAKGGT